LSRERATGQPVLEFELPKSYLHRHFVIWLDVRRYFPGSKILRFRGMDDVMNAQVGVWQGIMETARWAPTPHNTQAYRLEVVSDGVAHIYADNRCLTPATDPDGQFLYVGLGVFVEIMRLCAADKGLELKFDPGAARFKPGLKYLGVLTLCESSVTPDVDPRLILQRRTSRLPFDGVPVTAHAKDYLREEAQRYGQDLGFSDDPADIAAVLRFNTKILLYDIMHTGLRRDLTTWIRWTNKEYAEKKDGFSIPSLNQNGPFMWVFLRSYWLLRLPLARIWVQRRYERGITNVSTIGWLKGPFKTPSEWIRTGELLARLWLKATEHRLYVHPFGSVITNHAARQWALQQLNLTEGPGEMCWLLFRIGTGPEPARSLRHNTDDYFL